jgi:HSP20 family molecular chaperone IbpA
MAQEFDRPNYAVSVDLPELCDLATVSGTLENGLLKVNVKKRPETQPRKIAIA